MLLAHIFNPRLIAICVKLLIYDLIAAPEMNFVNAGDFDNFDKSSLTASTSLPSTFAIFMTDSNCCSAPTAAAAMNDVDQNENQIVFAAAEAAAGAANPYRTGRATFESHDLLSIIPAAATTTNTTTTTATSMTTGITTRNSSAVAMSASATSSPLPSPLPTSFPATSPLLPSQQRQRQRQRILSRSKRYLSFPEGASLSVAVCFTVGIIGNPRYNYMAFGLNWGTAYDLPNITWVLNHLHGFARHPVRATAVLRRRTRRALYKEIEIVVENMGYNGRDCVLRALCESRQYFQKTKMGMLGEMLRIIFSLPKQRIFTRELREFSDIELYDHAYRKARSVDCAEQYDCSFSLLELAFGKYSTPPAGYFEKH